jgi:O-antigen/teichoic acid export membrane protein
MLGWQAIVWAALSMALAQLLMFVTAQGDVWLAQSLTNLNLIAPDDVGLLGAVKRVTLITAVPTFLVQMTIASTIPDLVTQNRLTDLQRILRQAAVVSFAWSLLLCLPLILFSQSALNTLFGGTFYGSGGKLLIISSVGMIVFAWGGCASLVLMLTGRERSAVAIQLLAALILFLGGYVLAWTMGIVGVVIASAIAFAFQALASWLLVKADLGIWTHPGIESTTDAVRFLKSKVRTLLRRTDCAS